MNSITLTLNDKRILKIKNVRMWEINNCSDGLSEVKILSDNYDTVMYFKTQQQAKVTKDLEKGIIKTENIFADPI